MSSDDPIRAHCSAVANCSVAASVLAGPMADLTVDALRCAPLISAQFLAGRERSASGTLPWSIPEPWNGHLRTAPLLIVGQNPAANQDGENYPDSTWLGDEAKLLEFFENRYRLGYSGKVPFLARALAIAQDIFGPEVLPGRDFAITEAVRCKATKSVGVEHAVKSCAELHLGTTMKLSGARVILCLGATAREAFKIATKGAPPRAEEPFYWDGRLVVCFPHPSAWGGAGLANLPDKVLRQLREHLSLPLPDASQGTPHRALTSGAAQLKDALQDDDGATRQHRRTRNAS